jgi:hypothetical protein
MSDANTEKFTFREKAALRILFFILIRLNPTGYEHQIKNLRDEVIAELDRGVEHGGLVIVI